MKKVVIADTGPLVAFLIRQAQNYQWACETMTALKPPLVTCEAVLTEAAHLLRRHGREADLLFAWVERGVLEVTFSLAREHVAVRQLMRRYHDQPMSLADACLVRMAELHEKPCVWTLDSDFLIYRRLGRLVIPTLMPD